MGYMTDEEVVRFCEDGESGCPFHQTEVDALNEFWGECAKRNVRIV